MPGRGSQTFQKRQKEQQRKEKQQEKMAKRLAAKNAPPSESADDELVLLHEPQIFDDSDDRPDADVFGART